MAQRVELDGKFFNVEYLLGRPWYVEMKLATGMWRTIWHRNRGAMKPMARRVVTVAEKQIEGAV